MGIIRDILRLTFEAKLSLRRGARSLNIGLGTVSQHLKRPHAAALSWPINEGISDAALAALPFPEQANTTGRRFVEPDYAAMHKELKKSAGISVYFQRNTQSVGNAGIVPKDG